MAQQASNVYGAIMLPYLTKERLNMNQGNYINIGSTPCEEDCIGIGQPGARAECMIYARQLQRMYPEGDFVVKGFAHDFGHYYEVVAKIDSFDSPRTEAAFAAEGDDGGVWDEQAKREHTLLMATWSAA